jgi:hypothetical protein
MSTAHETGNSATTSDVPENISGTALDALHVYMQSRGAAINYQSPEFIRLFGEAAKERAGLLEAQAAADLLSVDDANGPPKTEPTKSAMNNSSQNLEDALVTAGGEVLAMRLVQARQTIQTLQDSARGSVGACMASSEAEKEVRQQQAFEILSEAFADFGVFKITGSVPHTDGMEPPLFSSIRNIGVAFARYFTACDGKLPDGKLPVEYIAEMLMAKPFNFSDDEALLHANLVVEEALIFAVQKHGDSPQANEAVNEPQSVASGGWTVLAGNDVEAFLTATFGKR